MPSLMPARGLYDPRFEHDSCGVSFVANLRGEQSNELVQTGLRALTNLEHRGATGAEPDTGDGAGILLQIPDRLFRNVVSADLPPAGAYAAGIGFLPQGDGAEPAKTAIEGILSEEGLDVVAWRELPIDPSTLGTTAREAMPSFWQLFCAAPDGRMGIELDRLTFIARKRIEHELSDVYFPSLSSRTIVYKGMLTTPQLSAFFPDLTKPLI